MQAGATGQLASYVPRTVLGLLPSTPNGAIRRSMPVRAAILIADIEGSTAFISAFAGEGHEGLDALHLFLRRYYGAMIEVITAFGGTVYQFAGDAILACFQHAPGEDDRVLAQRALAASIELRDRAATLGSVSRGDRTLEVRCKFGLSFGDGHRLLLGDMGQWIHPLLVGPNVESAVRAEKLARGGELIVSEALLRAVPIPVPAVRREGHYRISDHALLLPVDEPERTDRPLPQPMLDQVIRFVPPQLARRVGTGREDLIGDIREITALFLRFDLAGDEDLPSRVNDVNHFFSAVQQLAATYSGWLSQTDFTDKGNVLFVIFGAPTATEHKESMAARLAWKLLGELDRFPFLRQVQVGIATGPAYCGNVGAASRKGYTTIGQVAHLASRLMSLGEGTAVHVDMNTARELSKDFGLSAVDGLHLKGVPEPVPVFRLRSRSSLDHDQTDTAPRTLLVGRKAELAQLHASLERVATEGGQVLLLSGEAGIGKTSVAARAVEDARGMGFKALLGACFSFEMFTPYFPWRDLLSALLGLDPLEGRDRAVARIREALAGLEDAGPAWAPVVAGALGLKVEELPLTRNLEARSKHRRLFDIALQLIERQAAHGPLLLVVEDAHWADAISAELIEHVASGLGPLPIALLITSRPGETLPRLTRLPRLQHVALDRLPSTDAARLVRARLPLELPNLGLEDMILSKAQGNPFFIESIVQGLVERYGRSQLAGSMAIPEKMAEITIPDSIQDVVLGRIDHLDPTDQALIKTASVIGRVFALDDLLPLLAPDIAEPAARASIKRLGDLGMLDVESQDPLVLAFHHVLIQNVAYSAQLISNRARLHSRFAESIEARHSQARPAGLLAYHYLAAGDQTRALDYSLQAARSAREQYASRDAIHHYTTALGLLDQIGAPAATRRGVQRELAQALLQEGSYPEAIRLLEEVLGAADTALERADCYEGLGRIYSDCGESRLAIMALETSLSLSGRRVPRSLPGLGLAVVGAALALLVPATPSGARGGTGGVAALQLQQLMTLISMIRIYYFVDAPKLVWATLVALDLGRRTGSDLGNSLARIYLSTLLSAGFLLERSRVEANIGLELARKAGDPVAEATALSRLGNEATFANRLDEGEEYANRAWRMFRDVGEMWEIMTAVMLRGVTQFLKGEFDPAVRSFLEMATMARVLNARRHQAWCHGWAPMCRYLLGRAEAEATRGELEQALAVSVQLEDQANITTAHNHLANLAVREGDVEGAATAAVACFDAVWAYHVMVPFCQKGLIDAAEAALFALERGAVSVPRRKLRRIVWLAQRKAALIGRWYPYLAGPALRIRARALRLFKGVEAAEPVFDQAIQVLAASPNRWEHGVALLDASEALPHRAEALRAQARAVFEAAELLGELRRLERLGG